MDIITPSGGLLFWMLLIFAIVFFLLAKFGFPVITSMIRKRNSHISQSLENAREIEKRFAEMEVNCARMLNDARNEQARMLSDAKEASRKMVDDAREQARKQAQDILTQAEEEIARQKEEAVAGAGDAIVDLALAMAEKVLREKLSSEEKQQLFSQKLIGELQKEEGSVERDVR